MNVRRFAARSAREALGQVRLAFGDDAVVLSTRPAAGGVEVLAMAADAVPAFDAAPAVTPEPEPAPPPPLPAAEAPAASVEQDVAQLSMSTLSFQDYVRERMLRRRRAAQQAQERARIEAEAAQGQAAALAAVPMPASALLRTRAAQAAHVVAAAAGPVSAPGTALGAAQAAAQAAMHDAAQAQSAAQAAGYAAASAIAPPAGPAGAQPRGHGAAPAVAPEAAPAFADAVAPAGASSASQPSVELQPTADAGPSTAAPGWSAPSIAPPLAAAAAPSAMPPAHAANPLASLADAAAAGAALGAHGLTAAAAPEPVQPLLDELRAVKGLIEDRFGALAFLEKLQRQPRQAQLTHRLLDLGYSPVLVRKLADGLPDDCDELAWAASVLERNLATGEAEPGLEDIGGVYALVGPTGVGKTTSTAKLAAAFATRHGAANLGLITLDAYRVAAHEQLRAYGRILGVPVHTAHDRASLEDLLDLLAGKKLVLIDTAGMAQRDARTRELLDMLSHRSLQRLLVVNAAAQAETLDDVLGAYRAAGCRGVILSKLDEAVKLAPALDAMIRCKLKVLAVANGQRVPEDWHRLSAAALVRQSLRPAPSGAWRLAADEVQLVFAGLRAPAAAAARACA